MNSLMLSLNGHLGKVEVWDFYQESTGLVPAASLEFQRALQSGAAKPVAWLKGIGQRRA